MRLEQFPDYQLDWDTLPTNSTLDNMDPLTGYQGILNPNQVYHLQPPASNQLEQQTCMTPFAQLKEFPNHQQAYSLPSVASTPATKAVPFTQFQEFADHNQTYHQLPLASYHTTPSSQLQESSGQEQVYAALPNYTSNC